MTAKTKAGFAFLLAQILWVLMLAPAHAHDGKSALTEVLFNERSGFIEVAHRLILHDAEAAVEGKTRADLFSDANDRQALAAKVMQSFSIRLGPDGPVIPFRIVGSEIEGGYIWVYQDAQFIAPTDALYIRNSLFQDIWSDQINTVNVQRDKEVRTTVFTAASSVKVIDLD